MPSLAPFALITVISIVLSVASMKSTDSNVRQGLSSEELVELLNLGGHVEGGFFAVPTRRIIAC